MEVKMPSSISSRFSKLSIDSIKEKILILDTWFQLMNPLCSTNTSSTRLFKQISSINSEQFLFFSLFFSRDNHLLCMKSVFRQKNRVKERTYIEYTNLFRVPTNEKQKKERQSIDLSFSRSMIILWWTEGKETKRKAQFTRKQTRTMTASTKFCRWL